MSNPESVLENEIHIILWDLGIQADHLISARRLNRVIINRGEKKRKRGLAKFWTLLSWRTTE